MTYRTSILGAAVLAAALGLTLPVQAGALENMERERAIMLHSLLSAEFTPQKRQEKVSISRNRLLDLERMVLRDKSLVGKNTPSVQSAFDNYDLTFLVHASVERDRTLLDHWLDQVGVSTKSLMNAHTGRR